MKQSVYHFQNKIINSPLLQWLPQNALEQFEGCFDLEIENMNHNKTVKTNGRIGYLLQGKALIKQSHSNLEIQQNHLFGIQLCSKNSMGFEIAPCHLQTKTDCIILWMDYKKFHFVCYTCCWFHVRLLQEIPIYFKQQIS